jgi:hypothetical protein
LDLRAAKSIGHRASHVVNIMCPVCRHTGAFGGFPSCEDVVWEQRENNQHGIMSDLKGFAGVRLCPNMDCRAVVFVGRLVDYPRVVYPPEIIDFDATNLPEKILASLQEAIQCHATSAYKASALMVRRVLEELCADKSATGDNLKARILNLKSVAVIPTELLEAADELRILGNDAAHIDARDYDDIGQEESSLAIELAKELLKAVYQYASLVARLQALKRST